MVFDLNSISIILGERGSGKTDYLKGNPQHDLPGFFPIYLARKMKILIVDTIDHPSYRHIPFIPQDKLKVWKEGIYRIIVYRRHISEFCQYLDSLDSMWNTFLVFEDAAKHTKLQVSNGMNDLFINSKQKNIDITCMYHTWMQIPAEMYGMIDFIECFKVKASPKKREDAMPNYYDDAYNTWLKVMADKNKYAHEMIETGNTD